MRPEDIENMTIGEMKFILNFINECWEKGHNFDEWDIMTNLKRAKENGEVK